MLANPHRFANPTRAGRLLAVASSALLLTAAAPAVMAAETATADRYAMSQSGDGFVRLDKKTGEMAFCQPTDGKWACSAMDDPAAKLREELELLKRENETLQAEVERLEDPRTTPSLPQDGSAPPRTGIPGLNLPSEKEVDQALNYFERVMKKLRDTMKSLRDGQSDGSETPPSQPL